MSSTPLTWKSKLKKIEGPALMLVAALGMTTALVNIDFNLLEANLYDLRIAHGLQPEADSNIVLVTVDDATTKATDEFSPLPLDMHARFLEQLEKLEPKAVGYLVDFNKVAEANPELAQNREWGSRFVQAANRMQSHGISILLGTPYDVNGEVLPPYPLSSLPHSIAVLHKDSNVFSEDKVTRRALVELNDKPVFHAELAAKIGNLPQGYQPRGTFSVQEINARYFFFRYHGNTALERNRPGILPYSRVSFVDVMRGNVPAEFLRGKIVLVGTLSHDDYGDFATTPFSKSAFTNPKIVVHANILDSVMHDEGLLRMPRQLNWVLTFLAILFVLGWVLNSTPLYGVFATLSLAVLIVVIGQFAFQSYGIWIKLSGPLVGVFVAYYLGAPYRLISEYRKRWDYQRKNELLTQVEELKTNFLNLVTHDLKTPVARIQGLAEVLLRKSSERLLERDVETVHHIIASTEDLNRFISSILELSKVESNRLSLQIESKDINQLIEKLVESFKAQARAKQIRVEAVLEPLFSVKMDANLIGKVLSNLIDNAIKYSAPNSTVSVESREVGDFVEITIRDQGIGMSPEEVENLFTRFYRAKNDATTQIPGTGLGLYLTKFFIEAHKGRVEVESTKGRGSTFRVYLPLVEGEKQSAAKPGLRTLIQRKLKLKSKGVSNV